MAEEKRHLRTRFFLFYLLALASAFSTYKAFYFFESQATFGTQIIFINFAILLILWFLSFAHTRFIQKNFFMIIVLPLIGLSTTNILLLFTLPGTSFLGYLSYVVSSALLIFISYRARLYEKRM